MKRLFILLIQVVALASSELASAGVGSGGGTVEIKHKLQVRFNEVIERVSRFAKDYVDKEDANFKKKLVKFIQSVKVLIDSKNLQIEKVDTLKKCNDNQEIITDPEITAWGCLGKLQIKSNFDINDDSKIFHELTRLTSGFENWDDNFEISVNKLHLDINYDKGLFYIVRKFPKNEDGYKRAILDEATFKNYSIAFATNIKAEIDCYKLILVFQPFDSNISSIVEQISGGSN